MITRLEDFKVYNLAMEFGEEIYGVVSGWDYLDKDTVGKQLIKASDSIAANLAEGLGRYHFKESKNFGYYSRGSVYETKTWITKAYNRSLLTLEQFQKLTTDLETIGMMLNTYINSLGAPKEPLPEYTKSFKYEQMTNA